MIKKVEILISFPQGAYFTNDINLNLYQRFINFVKDLTCVCVDTKCKNCQFAKKCRYYLLTGENFSQYPGVLIKKDIFEKRRYEINEEKRIVFYLIGSLKSFIGYFEVFFEHLEQNLNGNLFYLKKIQVDTLETKIIKTKYLKLCTPILQKDFIESYNQMVLYYNEHYLTDFSEIIEESIMINERMLSLLPFHVKTKKIIPNGFVGDIVFQNDAKMDLRLNEIGIGQYNFIGGGKIEIKDHTGN